MINIIKGFVFLNKDKLDLSIIQDFSISPEF